MVKIDNNSGKVRVSVILPAYNEELVLEQTLQTILNQDFNEPIELIVANNNSTDRTVEIAQKMGAKVVNETRKGTRFAYEAGMRAATGEFILATNADVRLPNNWIKRIVESYDQNPKIVGVGTKVRFYNSPEWVNAFMAFADIVNPKPAMWGVSLSCRRQIYQKVGGFNHGVNTNEDAIFSLLIEKFGQVKILSDVVAEMDGRRFNQGFMKALYFWVTGIGLNGLYIQFNYLMFGQIKSLINDFGDIRSSVFGKGEQTQISVIIPVSNNQDTLARTLSTLQNQDFNYRFKIYVLDNFSIDLSLQIARVFPNVTVASYPKIYDFGGRLRALIKQIDSPVIAFTSAEGWVPENWLQEIYREFNKERKQKLDILSGPYMYDNSRLISTLTNQPIDKISNNLEFSNFAITSNAIRKLVPREGNLETVSDTIRQQAIKRGLNTFYSLNFRALHDNSTILGSIIDNSSKTFKHTLRRVMKPITQALGTDS